MKKISIVKLFVFLLVVVVSMTTVLGQKKKRPAVAKPTPPAKVKSVIFAVVNDGASLEPIGYIENGKLTEAATGMSDGKIIETFNKTYYQPKATYNLIFGGNLDGKAAVVKSNAAAECAKNMADVTSQATKAKLKGFVMALATNAPMTKAGSGVRRKPTFAEKAEIDRLAQAEFTKQKAALTGFNYHNLTAIDVDNDGKVEFVGTYWVEPNPKERGLLFFIAEKNSSGKYVLTHSDYKLTKESDVMNSEIKALDEGIYHELLLDVFDVDGDGVSEIFTIDKGFEANGFNVYHRESGKWTKTFEVSNYHCGY